jgi:hypothetical protein
MPYAPKVEQQERGGGGDEERALYRNFLYFQHPLLCYHRYGHMMPKSQKFGFREVSQRCPLVPSSLLKHVSAATDMQTAEELFLGVCMYSNQSITKQCKESQ